MWDAHPPSLGNCVQQVGLFSFNHMATVGMECSVHRKQLIDPAVSRRDDQILADDKSTRLNTSFIIFDSPIRPLDCPSCLSPLLYFLFDSCVLSKLARFLQTRDRYMVTELLLSRFDVYSVFVRSFYRELLGNGAL